MIENNIKRQASKQTTKIPQLFAVILSIAAIPE